MNAAVDANWKTFAAEEITEMTAHLMAYPVQVCTFDRCFLLSDVVNLKKYATFSKTSLVQKRYSRATRYSLLMRGHSLQLLA